MLELGSCDPSSCDPSSRRRCAQSYRRRVRRAAAVADHVRAQAQDDRGAAGGRLAHCFGRRHGLERGGGAVSQGPVGCSVSAVWCGVVAGLPPPGGALLKERVLTGGTEGGRQRESESERSTGKKVGRRPRPSHMLHPPWRRSAERHQRWREFGGRRLAAAAGLASGRITSRRRVRAPRPAHGALAHDAGRLRPRRTCRRRTCRRRDGRAGRGGEPARRAGQCRWCGRQRRRASRLGHRAARPGPRWALRRGRGPLQAGAAAGARRRGWRLAKASVDRSVDRSVDGWLVCQSAG